MASPLSRRRRRAAIVISSLLSWTCGCSEFSTAFTPPINSPLLSTAANVAPTYFSCTTTSTLSNHHYLTKVRPTAATHLHLFKKKNSPLEDEPWKKDDSYWDQLQAASKDPEQFEKFIEETMAKKKKTNNSSSSSSYSTSTLAAAYTNNQEEKETPKKKKAYVPIEEWDATNKDNMSKEERLQWECQQSGNRYRQNEILMHNLKSF